jgi:hypothetical protein
VFGAEMLYLEMMFQQSRGHQSKQQDEDVNSDEELIIKNTKECLIDLREAIDSFVNSRLKREKQKFVRNYQNKDLTFGKVGALRWENELSKE